MLRSLLGTSFLDRVDLSSRLSHGFLRRALGLVPYIAFRFMEFALKRGNFGSRGCLSVLRGALANLGFLIRELLSVLAGQGAANLVGFALCYCGTDLLHSAVEFWFIHSFGKRLPAYRASLCHYSSSFYISYSTFLSRFHDGAVLLRKGNARNGIAKRGREI